MELLIVIFFLIMLGIRFNTFIEITEVTIHIQTAVLHDSTTVKTNLN